MNRTKQLGIILSLMVAMLVSCGGSNTQKPRSENRKSTPATPSRKMADVWSWRVVEEYPHSTESYTQGLQYVDGVMWESTGQHGMSHLQRIDLATGKVEVVASLDKREFGEGMTFYKGRIYQLTWLSERAYVYDSDGRLVDTLTYKGEGWGITTDGQTLYMSDGTSTIRRVNPETMATESSIFVTLDGHPLDMLNELEWIDGKIWANVYMTYSIVVIDPATGVVEAYIDLPQLDNSKHNPKADVLNGIAYDSATGRIFITGKNWDKLYQIEITK